MYDKKHRPSWWLLYLSLPMMVILFLFEIGQPLSETGHKLAEFVILLFIFGYIWLWLKANTGAIIHEDLERWREASRMVSRPPTLHVEKNVPTNGNLNQQYQRGRVSIYKHLARWASTISGFFHL
jgi:hypothetical protein